MGVNLSSVDWNFVWLMTALAFVTALLGSLIAYRNRFGGAIIAAILFGIGFVVWNYYPHSFGLPVLKSTKLDTAAAPTSAAAPPPATSAPATPAAPSKPGASASSPQAPAAPSAPAPGGAMAPNAAH
jgi:hypothetical protein